MATVVSPHIEVDSRGVPYLTGTQTKVVETVLDRLAHHWDADEIHRQHPHLSLAQIYSALAYYYDHQAEIDRHIEDQIQRLERIRNDLGPSPIRQKLVEKGLLP
jgi:uncharacterized protein (DUF433 family)